MNSVGARKMLAVVLVLLWSPGLSLAADAETPLSESEARDLLARKLQEDALYGSSIPPECLSFHTERAGRHMFDFTVQPKSDGRCAQARAPARGVDEFRVRRATGEILWWDHQEGEYAEYERAKNYRKP